MAARRGLLVLLILSVALPVAARPAEKMETARLRALFFQRDSETAVIEGNQATVLSSSRAEAKAWYLINLAQAGRDLKAVVLAETLTKERPNDGWSWFALAGTLNLLNQQPGDAQRHAPEAIAAAGKALALLARHPDAVWLTAKCLASDEKRRDEAIAFVDRERSHLRHPAELLVVKGDALFAQSRGAQRDQAKVAAALATFEEARRIDPTAVNAWLLPGTYLNMLRRSDEAYPLLKRATALAPGSARVHSRFWDTVNGSRDFSAERKRAEIEADVTALLKAHGNRPGILAAVVNISREMKWTERRRTCEERLLSQFSDSPEAAWVLVYRWRDMERDGQGRMPPEFRQTLAQFIARPQQYDNALLGEAHSNLFKELARDESTPGEELYRIGEGALKYEINDFVWYDVPKWLADRKVHLIDAERIARQGLEDRRKRFERQRDLYPVEQEYDRALAANTSSNRDALGWVLFALGRFAEAERELTAAYEADHEDRGVLDHLGRFYLARGDDAKAEAWFVKGLSAEAPGANPCETALRALYAKRHGSERGFNEYVASLRDADRGTRREKVLGARLTNSETVPPFDLKDLSGKRVSLDSLTGKIVVVNYWGTWCGWCVQELPDYQKLFEKYAADPDVAILTIDNDSNPETVPDWMAQRKFTFPVLLDDGYVADKAAVHGFPTTWFLDRQGRKAFEKIGWSENLVEEFSWRIEALRGGRH